MPHSKNEDKETSELEESYLFQQYGDAFIQSFHFVMMCVDMTHDEIYMVVENIYGVCDIHHPNKIEIHKF